MYIQKLWFKLFILKEKVNAMNIQRKYIFFLQSRILLDLRRISFKANVALLIQK